MFISAVDSLQDSHPYQHHPHQQHPTVLQSIAKWMWSYLSSTASRLFIHINSIHRFFTNSTVILNSCLDMFISAVDSLQDSHPYRQHPNHQHPTVLQSISKWMWSYLSSTASRLFIYINSIHRYFSKSAVITNSRVDVFISEPGCFWKNRICFEPCRGVTLNPGPLLLFLNQIKHVSDTLIQKIIL